jgi:hypothetical protein
VTPEETNACIQGVLAGLFESCSLCASRNALSLSEIMTIQGLETHPISSEVLGSKIPGSCKYSGAVS